MDQNIENQKWDVNQKGGALPRYAKNKIKYIINNNLYQFFTRV